MRITAIAFLLCFAGTMAHARGEIDYNESKTLTGANYRPGTVRHIVTFKFHDGVDQNAIDEVNRRFLALKDLCRRNGQPYILSIESGTSNSHEGADQGMQVAFIVTFRSQGDRNFYVGQPLIEERFSDLYDPAHLEFKRFVGPLLATPAVPNGVFVFDFTVGH